MGKNRRRVQKRKRRTFPKRENAQREHFLNEELYSKHSWHYTEGEHSKLRNGELSERRLFTTEERKAILKKCHGHCACCGKQLTERTMTVDHMIPLSRGGSNDISNLAPLCKPCNRIKSNTIYLPNAFYIYATVHHCLTEYKRLFAEWFDSFYKDFPLEFAPMVSPRKLTYLVPHIQQRAKAPKDIPRQFLMEIFRVGKEFEDEFSAVTGLLIKGVRSDTNMITYGQYRNMPAVLYCAKMVSSQKYLAAFAVLLDKESHEVSVYIPWHDQTRSYCDISSIFVFHLIRALREYAHEDIREVNLYAVDENSLHDPYLRAIGIGRTPIREKEIEGIGTVYEMDIALYYDSTSLWYRGSFTGDKDKAEEESLTMAAELEEGRRIADERYAAAHQGRAEELSADDAIERFFGEELDDDERGDCADAG